jgi:hypothetical protein
MPDRDGLEQVADLLFSRSGTDAIHLTSHGIPGTLYLGSTVPNSQALGQYADLLHRIGSSLTITEGDVLLYGCNVGQSDAGATFAAALAGALGADVQASSDITGPPALSGNWNLEVTAIAHGRLTQNPAPLPRVLPR